MVNFQSNPPFLGIEVPPAEVERALIKTWREAAQDDVAKERLSGPANEVTARVKATLANLIIIEGDTPPAGTSLDELITELCLSFPSRFCVVRYRSDFSGGPALKTGVSSRCVLARSGAHVCSEELYIGAGPDSIQHVANLVLSVLVPDTPVVLLVSTDPSQETSPAFHELLASLRHMSDRIIFDSRHLKNYGAVIGELLSDTSSRIIKGSYGSSACSTVLSSDIRDLTWHRMGRWRGLVTELFDGDRAAAPSRINYFRIESDIPFEDLAAGILPVNALLLAGWFASRLGWQFQSGAIDKSKKAATLKATSPSGLQIDVEIAAQPGGKGIRRINAIEFGFDGAAGLTKARMARNLAGETVEVSTTFNYSDNSGESTVKRLSPFASIPDVGALTHELMSGYADLDYCAATMASRQVWNFLVPEVAAKAGEA